jgi:topoisomerase IA-like protein
MTKKTNRKIPYDKIAAMFISGKTTPEIAKATGLTVKGSDPTHYIRAILTRARINGWVRKDGKRVHLQERKVVLMTAKKEAKKMAKSKTKKVTKPKTKKLAAKKVAAKKVAAKKAAAKKKLPKAKAEYQAAVAAIAKTATEKLEVANA